MELHEVENGSHVVELYYRRSGVLEMLTIRGCERSCPLERVFELIGSDAIYEEKELVQMCKGGDDPVESGATARTRVPPFLLIFGSVLLALAIMQLAIACVGRETVLA